MVRAPPKRYSVGQIIQGPPAKSESRFSGRGRIADSI